MGLKTKLALLIINRLGTILEKQLFGVDFGNHHKSMFRFGEPNKAQEIKTTEYILIGTFASFTVAILIGFGVLQIIK